MATNLTVGTERKAVVVDNPFCAATLADWIQFCDVQKPTQTTYNKGIQAFAGYLKTNGVDTPTRQDIINFRKWMLDEDNGGENPIYKVSTARLYMTVIKKFFAWLASKGLYLNVADGVKLPALGSEHAHDALTLKESKKVILSFKGRSEKCLRDKAIMSLMIGAGLRSVEVVRLNIGDIEKRRGQWFMKIHGKARAGKVDSVPLSAELKALIDQYLKARPKGKISSPLFISTSRRNLGQRLQTQTVSRLAKKVFASNGIESARVTCHSCRATACTLMLEAGIDIRRVARILRHKDTKVTEVYARDLNDFNNRGIDILSNMLFAA